MLTYWNTLSNFPTSESHYRELLLKIFSKEKYDYYSRRNKLRNVVHRNSNNSHIYFKALFD